MVNRLSVLRFVLIVMVFMHHLQLYKGGGTLGVASFFVLSGFCMTLGYKDKILNSNDKFDYVNFLKKRLIKFVPLHWICLIIVLLPTLRIGVQPNIHVLISNIALLQSWIPQEEYYFSYNALSWYLSDAMFLSMVFPLILLFISNQKIKTRISLLVLLLEVYLLLVLIVPSSMRHALLYINPLCRSFDFVVGVFTAFLFLQWQERNSIQDLLKKHKYLPDVFIIFSIVVLVVLSSVINEKYLTIAGIYWPFIVVMIMAFALQQDTFLRKVFESKCVLIATQSTFSFYMIHIICINQLNPLLSSFPDVVRVAVVFIITYLFSQLLYYIIERYATKHLVSWLIRSKQ